MRRALGDAAISTAAVVLLLLTLVSVDERVRERIAALFQGASSPTQVIGAGRELGGVALIVFDAVKDQSVEHAPLLLFTLAATVLVLFMVRT